MLILRNAAGVMCLILAARQMHFHCSRVKKEEVILKLSFLEEEAAVFFMSSFSIMRRRRDSFLRRPMGRPEHQPSMVFLETMSISASCIRLILFSLSHCLRVLGVIW